MRVAEISNPLSFHTEQWANQLMERSVEPHVVYVKEWMGSPPKKVPEISCTQFLLTKPRRTTLVTSMMRRGRFGTLLKGVRNKTTLHSQLEIYGPLLNKYFREQEIDVVHAHQLTTGALLAHAAGFKPAVITAWGSDLVVAPRKYPYLRPLIKKAIEWADVIHVESEISASIIKQIHPVEDDRLFISSWGVDTDLFVRRTDTEDFRQKYGIADRPVVISFRALEPLYRIDLVIRAFALVLKEHPSAVLLVGNDGSLREDLVKLCKYLGISDNVVFTGYLFGEEMTKAFAVSDVYVQCPISDGVTISGMQAMSAEVPIVANNVAEVSALVDDGVSGFFVSQPDDPKDYAEKISLLLSDDELRRKMGSDAREIVKRKHSRKLFLEKYIALFEKLRNQYQQ